MQRLQNIRWGGGGILNRNGAINWLIYHRWVIMNADKEVSLLKIHGY